MTSVNSEDDRKVGRAACEVAVGPLATAAQARDFDAREHLTGTDQNGRAVQGPATHHVRAPVLPVDEVRVQVSGLAEHHGISFRRPTMGMGGRVCSGASIRFDLSDPDRDGTKRSPGLAALEDRSEQKGRDAFCRAREVGAAQRTMVHPSTILPVPSPSPTWPTPCCRPRRRVPTRAAPEP